MTRLFPPTDGPRVFALPPGVDFSRALVAGLDARLAGQPPEAMARVEIWVNTRRARRSADRARSPPGRRGCCRASGWSPSSPTDPLGPLDLAAAGAGAAPQARARAAGRRAGRRRARASPPAPRSSTSPTASPSSSTRCRAKASRPRAFAGVDAGEHAAHWQRSLRFLGLLAGYLAAAGPSDGQGRMRAAAEALAAAWAAAAAAASGDRRRLHRLARRHPRLHGGGRAAAAGRAGAARASTPACRAAVWQRLGADDPGAADHPQHGFRAPRRRARLRPGARCPPGIRRRRRRPERNALVSLALRPAPVTDQWRQRGRARSPARSRPPAPGSPGSRRPTRAPRRWRSRSALREAAEARRARGAGHARPALARRVTAELDRWGLIPDDSAGRPLALTPPGVLLRRLADAAGRRGRRRPTSWSCSSIRW